jgi:hypothetical protein
MTNDEARRVLRHLGGRTLVAKRTRLGTKQKRRHSEPQKTARNLTMFGNVFDLRGVPRSRSG